MRTKKWIRIIGVWLIAALLMLNLSACSLLSDETRDTAGERGSIEDSEGNNERSEGLPRDGNGEDGIVRPEAVEEGNGNEGAGSQVADAEDKNTERPPEERLQPVRQETSFSLPLLSKYPFISDIEFADYFSDAWAVSFPKGWEAKVVSENRVRFKSSDEYRVTVEINFIPVTASALESEDAEVEVGTISSFFDVIISNNPEARLLYGPEYVDSAAKSEGYLMLDGIEICTAMMPRELLSERDANESTIYSEGEEATVEYGMFAEKGELGVLIYSFYSEAGHFNLSNEIAEYMSGTFVSNSDVSR